MAAVPTAIEEFCKAHQYTIAALAAVGTCSAVVAALWIALRADRTRISAFAAITYWQYQRPYLTVRIHNNSLFPVTVQPSFFYLKIPLRARDYLTAPMDFVSDQFIKAKRYPVNIPARDGRLFVLCEIEMLQDLFRAKNSNMNRWGGWLYRAYVTTVDGKSVRVRLDASVRNELRKLRKSKPA
jgi:hypothetical protein